MRWPAPGLIVAALVVLILSQLLYVFAPYRRRRYVPVLLLTAIGVALGQLWDYAGLPAFRLGETNLLPGLVLRRLENLVEPRTYRKPARTTQPSGAPSCQCMQFRLAS